MLMVLRNNRTKVEKKKECHKFFTKNSTPRQRRRGQKEVHGGQAAPHRPSSPRAWQLGHRRRRSGKAMPAAHRRLTAGKRGDKPAAAAGRPGKRQVPHPTPATVGKRTHGMLRRDIKYFVE